MNQLEALKKFTTIVIDSGENKYIHKYTPEDATTNPSLILQVSNIQHYHSLLNDAISYAKKKGGTKKEQIINASDKFSVNVGIEILKNISGLVSTEIDARFSFNSEMCIIKAKKILDLYNEQGIDKSRILIKLASTWEGIKAAEILQKMNINCNLTLLFSFSQAKACAESNIYLISPFVGRIYDWYQQRNLINTNDIHEDPGIKFVKKIHKYYKEHNYKTIIMGASFRTTKQVLELAGCDKLTISPLLLKELFSCHEHVERRLYSLKMNLKKPMKLSEEKFRWEFNQNAMAVEKLSEGIRQFSVDQRKLEFLLSKKI